MDAAAEYSLEINFTNPLPCSFDCTFLRCMDFTQAGQELIALSSVMGKMKAHETELARHYDAKLANAVAEFEGDINMPFAAKGWCRQPLLTFVLGLGVNKAPLTFAALAARHDVDLYCVDEYKSAPVFRALKCGTFPAFFAEFPRLDVNVSCDAHGNTPLAVLAGRKGWSASRDELNLQMLLNAGAIVTDATVECFERKHCPAVSALLAQHRRWGSLRSAWAVAVHVD